MKKLSINAYMHGVVNLLSKHASPKRFCHVLFDFPAKSKSSIIGIGLLRNTSRPSKEYLNEDGSEPHSFFGGMVFNYEESAEQDLSKPPAISKQNTTIDIYLPGHIISYRNEESYVGTPICTIVCTDELTNVLRKDLTLWENGNPTSKVSGILGYIDTPSFIEKENGMAKVSEVQLTRRALDNKVKGRPDRKR